MKYYDIGNVQASVQKLKDNLFEVQIVQLDNSHARFRYFFNDLGSALKEILSYAEIDKDDFDVR